MEEVSGENWHSVDDFGIGFMHCGEFHDNVARSPTGEIIGYCNECYTMVIVIPPPGGEIPPQRTRSEQNERNRKATRRKTQ